MRHLNNAERQELIELLSALIGIDSSVPSDDLMDSARVEERMAAFVADRLRAIGMKVETYLYQPGRPNLVAHWCGQGGPRSLMLEAHMDTVGVAGMTIPPFEPTLREGRLYGRGACDTKGSLAAFMTALALAYRADRLPADKLYFVAAAAEETGCRGAAALMEQGFRTDAAIVGEPTRCRAVTCHKGPLWMEVITRGRACHASQPEHGRNAIERMGRVLAYIHGPWQDYIRQVEHPLLGRSTSQPTLIAGGSKVNIIPAECRLQVDSRFVPWQPPEALVAAFRSGLAEYLGDADFEIGSVEAFPALDTPANIPIAARLLGLCEAFNGQSGPEGVTYFADSGRYAAAGVTSVLFGPGDIAQAHTADEFIAIDQLVQGTEIILNLLLSHAGRSIVADD